MKASASATANRFVQQEYVHQTDMIVILKVGNTAKSQIMRKTAHARVAQLLSVQAAATMKIAEKRSQRLVPANSLLSQVLFPVPHSNLNTTCFLKSKVLLDHLRTENDQQPD